MWLGHMYPSSKVILVLAVRNTEISDGPKTWAIF